MFNGVVLAEAEVLKWQYAVFNGVVLMCSQGGSHEGWLELLYCDVMRGRVDPEDDIIRMHYLIWKKKRTTCRNLRCYCDCGHKITKKHLTATAIIFTYN